MSKKIFDINKKEDWIFVCPKHGHEHGLFCNLAYDDKHVECWIKVTYTIKKKRGVKLEDKKEWLRIMKLTRNYNGHLPQ